MNEELEEWNKKIFQLEILCKKYYTTKSTAYGLMWCLRLTNKQKDYEYLGEKKNSSNVDCIIEITYSDCEIDLHAPKEWIALVKTKIMQGHYRVTSCYEIEIYNRKKECPQDDKNKAGGFVVYWKEEVEVTIMVEKYSGRVK